MKCQILSLGLLLASISSFCQVNVTTLTKENSILKKENEALKNAIKILKQDTTYLRNVTSTCELLVKSKDFELTNTNGNLKFELLSVKGDRNSQTAKIEFFISHEILHQQFDLHTGDGKPKAWDLLGSLFDYKGAIFSNNNNPSWGFNVIPVYVPTNVKVKGEIAFRNILPSTEKFSLIQIKYYLYNSDGGSSTETQTIEIKNARINW